MDLLFFSLVLHLSCYPTQCHLICEYLIHVDDTQQLDPSSNSQAKVGSMLEDQMDIVWGYSYSYTYLEMTVMAKRI